MSPAEADRRINLSRRTLSRYVQMTAAGVDPAQGTLNLAQDEIAVLAGIVEDHPGQTERLAALVFDWLSFRDGIRAKLY